MNLSQAVDSHQEMLVLCLVSPNFSTYCLNRVGVCSKNCLICSFKIHHTCWGDVRLVGHSDLSLAVAKTIPSFVITSDVQSLRWALGNCAGNLGMARGRAYRSIPW